MKTDLIIIGAGPGGYETAITAARAGQSVILIESGAIGGTCLNEGCIPTKCYCRHAEILRIVRDAQMWGITMDNPTFDLAVARQRKDDVVARLTAGVATQLSVPNLEIVRGSAVFVDSHTIGVGEATYTAPHILIATGSVAKYLPVSGADSSHVITSKEMLEIASIPPRLCIVGGGVIGLEFASIFNTFGSEVSVVEYAREVVPAFDRDIAKRLRLSLKKQGVNFYLGATVTAIETEKTAACIHFSRGEKEEEIIADKVLMAVGRAPRLAELHLECAGIRYNSRGIEVDQHFETNVAGVYAIGDVNGICPLAHAATAQGRYVLSLFADGVKAPDMRYIPAALFTYPEVAAVGLTEEAAKACGMVYTTRKNFYRANGKSLTMGNDEGLVKVLIGEDDYLLGAHVMGPHASDLIHELALAMHSGITFSELQQLVHAHPSLSELMQGMS